MTSLYKPYLQESRIAKFYFILLVNLFSFNFFGCSQTADEDATAKVFYPDRIRPVEDQVDIWSLNIGGTYFPVNSDYFRSEATAFYMGLNYHYEFTLFFSPLQTVSFGLGYNYSRINHKGQFVSELENDFWQNANTIPNFEKGSLRFHSIAVPIEYRFRLKRGIKVYFGYLPELITSDRDVVLKDGDKFINRNLESINDFIHGGQVRIGFKDVFIFFYHSFSSPLNYIGVNNQTLYRFGISIGG